MGFLSAIVKYVSWGKVASLAMEYGPLFLRQFREGKQQEDAASPPVAAELNDRVSRLEKLLAEQESIISEQTTKNRALEEICRELESQCDLLKMLTSIALGISLLLLVLLIVRW